MHKTVLEDDIFELQRHLMEDFQPIRAIIVMGMSGEMVEHVMKNTPKGATIVMSQAQFDELCHRNVKNLKIFDFKKTLENLKPEEKQNGRIFPEPRKLFTCSGRIKKR